MRHLLLAAFALAAPSAALADAPGLEARIVGESMLSTRPMKNLVELCDRFPSRVTGTQAQTNAADWAEARFKESGLSARQERYRLDHPWQAGRTELSVVTPAPRALSAETLLWALGTPPGGVEGPLAVVRADEVVKQAPGLRGAVVLVTPPFEPGSFAVERLQFLAIATALHGAGAAAMLIELPYLITPKALVTTGDGSIAPLPMAVVAAPDAKALEGLAAAGAARMKLIAPNVIAAAPGFATNIVAEIPGSGDEVVVLSAHLDTVQGVPGATDDGAGVVVLEEVARVLRGLKIKPRRTIRFLLFSGEEEMLLGARAYTAQHAAELEKISVDVELDGGEGRINGFDLLGREELLPALQKTLRPPFIEGVAPPPGDPGKPEPLHADDASAFVLEGIPALEVIQEDHDYMSTHHRPTDTPDKVEPRDLAFNAAVLGLFAWRLANDDARFGKRLGHDEVRALVHRYQQEPDLRFMGIADKH